MTTLYIAMQDRMVVVSGDGGSWRAEGALENPGTQLQCVAADPAHPERVYCGTFGKGLWISDDGGVSWRAISDTLAAPYITSVAVSPTQATGGYGVVWAGTEPSALYRSEDGGESWTEPAVLTEIPSSGSWSFPPRPFTHHARWIALSPHDPGSVLVSIEAGGIVRSLDGGRTWEDRKPDGPYDAHTVVTHAEAPGRVWVAAGDGYFESSDFGSTWTHFMDGLRHRYLWSIAVTPGDPETVVVSAARGPGEAHSSQYASSTIYRRQGTGPWVEVTGGLPDTRGTIVPELASSPAEPGVHYLASNHGVFRSADSGLTWSRLEIPWPSSLRYQHVQGMVVNSH